MTVAVSPPQPPTARRANAFARINRRRRPWWLLVVLVLIIAGVVAAVVLRRHRAPPASHFLTARVSRGDVVEQIRATGAVQPVLQVQVGAQVSGRVATVSVDYNSRVHTNDLLAEIDPTPYRAQVAQARANLMQARAQLAQNHANLVLADQNLVRAQQLRTRGLNAQADLDSAVATRDAARAAVGVAAAQVAQSVASLDVAQTNLTYTRILAPIDGIVATRSVDPGQTVAASFQTPTLFTIANDLLHMRVIANVDEANIGKLAEGMAATARVDAFPRETFHGSVRELRINPTTTNGVVTYQAVIDVENPQNRLRPGMTATITVVTVRDQGVLRVPNAALRYRPSDAPAGGGGGGSHAGGGGSHAGAGGSHAGAGGSHAGAGGSQAGGVGDGAGATPDDGSSEVTPDRGTIYVLRAGQPHRVRVTIGVTDGVYTEVTGPGLDDGTEIVLDETDSTTGAPRAGGPRVRMF